VAKHERFYINVFNGCNLNCRHCFNNEGATKGPLLTTPEILRLSDEAMDCLGITEMQLTGGEPLQRPDIFPLISALQEKGLKVILQTNGFFDRDTVRKIQDLSRNNLSLIISMDGFETNDYFRGRGVTARTVANIEMLSESVDIRINTLLSSRIEWEEVENLAKLAERHSIQLAFNPICPSGRADSTLLLPAQKYFQWMYRLEELSAMGISIRKCFNVVEGHLVENEDCPVRKGATVHIAADGAVYPCGFLVNKQACFLGSVRESSILDLMKRIPDDCRSLHPDCQKCEYHIRRECKGGCPARILNLKGRFGEKDIYCMAEHLPNLWNR